MNETVRLSADSSFHLKYASKTNHLIIRLSKKCLVFSEFYTIFRHVICVSEHLNILLFELSKSYHGALQTVDTSGYDSGSKTRMVSVLFLNFVLFVSVKSPKWSPLCWVESK